MKNNRKNRKGFTLLEIILVIAVIGILAAMLSPRFAGIFSTATTNSTASDKAVANRILEAFEGSGGTFGATSTATQMNNTSASTLYVDLRAGKTVNGVTFALPTTSPAAVPSGWAVTSNRFN